LGRLLRLASEEELCGWVDLMFEVVSMEVEIIVVGGGFEGPEWWSSKSDAGEGKVGGERYGRCEDGASWRSETQTHAIAEWASDVVGDAKMEYLGRWEIDDDGFVLWMRALWGMRRWSIPDAVRMVLVAFYCGGGMIKSELVGKDTVIHDKIAVHVARNGDRVIGRRHPLSKRQQSKQFCTAYRFLCQRDSITASIQQFQTGPYLPSRCICGERAAGQLFLCHGNVIPYNARF
jgi:hypothetical protein